MQNLILTYEEFITLLTEVSIELTIPYPDDLIVLLPCPLPNRRLAIGAEAEKLGGCA